MLLLSKYSFITYCEMSTAMLNLSCINVTNGLVSNQWFYCFFFACSGVSQNITISKYINKIWMIGTSHHILFLTCCFLFLVFFGTCCPVNSDRRVNDGDIFRQFSMNDKYIFLNKKNRGAQCKFVVGINLNQKNKRNWISGESVFRAFLRKKRRYCEGFDVCLSFEF